MEMESHSNESVLVNPNVMEALKLECDAYKEKLNHLKVYINEQKYQLQSQKIRKEGVETLSKLLTESRQEISTLQRQKKTLETLIRNLQNRLATNGLSDSVTFGENELFIPGISKQIFDNLAKENARLRNMIGTPSEFVGLKTNSMLQETVDKLTTDNANLQKEVMNLQKTILDVEGTLRSSSSDKDQEIAGLLDRERRARADAQLQTVLCATLAGEVGGLRGRLRQFIVSCQTAELRLEEAERQIQQHSEHVEEKGSSAAVTHQASEDSPNLITLKEENDKLHEKLQEVTEMNSRWQDYNSNREKYVQGLHNKIVDLEQRLKSTQNSPQKTQKMEGLLKCASEKLQKETETREKLKAELGQSLAENQRLQTIVATSDDAATIEALKAQIQICTEDFETERQDREKAQTVIEQLQAEVHQLKMEQQRHVMQFPNRGSSSIPPTQTYARPRLGLDPQSLQSRGVTGGRTVADGLKSDGPDAEGVGPVSLPLVTSPRFHGSALSAKHKPADLCCPKCSLGFSEAEQDKLLEHMEECCE